MQVPDEVRKCVCFVGYRKGGKYRLGGTAFFLGASVAGTEIGWGATITARHVIDAIKAESDDGRVYLRLNLLKGGYATVHADVNDWVRHPGGKTVDVAGLPWLPDLGLFDHLVYTLAQVATDELIHKERISVGDELFFPGLFIDHVGATHNVPIVRTGNIAAMPDEPVETKLGSIEAYLAEARSIGGLSGSPVFVNLGPARQTDSLPPLTLLRVAIYLVGVMHGHFRARITDPTSEYVNQGIAIVVPISKVLELLDESPFLEMKSAVERTRSLPALDSATDANEEWAEADIEPRTGKPE